MSGVVGIITAAVGVASLISGMVSKGKANKKAKKQEQKQLEAEKKLVAFENNRQAVINQSGKIRAMKDQVFNPMANLAVATQASDLKIEQTDQALANTLDQINQSGTGAGAATALARMAAASKAQVGASIENQEVQNNKLRAEGQAQANQQKMQLEQAAIAEETGAWGRQEDRDLASMDRLAGQGENAQAAAMGYQAQGDAAMMAGLTTSAAAFTGGGMEGFAGDDVWDGFGVTTP